MTSRVAVALACLLLSALTASPASAQAERRAPLVSAEDASGDVAIRDVDGPTDRQRRSVDILDVKVVPRDGLIRFTFRIAEVTTSTDFDQLLTVALVDAEPGAERTEGRISLRVQHTKSGRADASVETETEGSGAGCLFLPVVVARARGLVKLDVFHGCLPPGDVSIRVKSFTTTPKGERRSIYSRDFLRVPGSHDLGGRVGSEPRA